jgi:hypothetical protein
MGSVNRFAPGGCNCGVSLLVRGCGNLPLTDHDIDVYDEEGGTLLLTVTADGSGYGTFPAGEYWLVPQNGRFAGQTVTVSTPGTVTFSPATGYHCLDGCADPLPDTLDATYASTSYSLVYGTYNLKGTNYTGWMNTAAVLVSATVASNDNAITCQCNVAGSCPTYLLILPTGVLKFFCFVSCACPGFPLTPCLMYQNGPPQTGALAILTLTSVAITCPPALSIQGTVPATISGAILGSACANGPYSALGSPGGGGTATVTE